MKVAMVTGSYPPLRCGIGDYTQHLCHALTLKGIEITAWTRLETPLTTHHSPLTTEWTWRGVKRLISDIAATQPDLVHVQYPGRGYGHRIAPTFFGHAWKRWGSGAPLVLTLHEFRIAHPLRKLAALNLVRSADALIVVASCERESLSRFWKSPSFSIAVIPPGANVPVQPITAKRRHALRASWGVADDDVLLCYFGFIQRNKNFPRLLEAFSQARAEMPNVKLLIIGEHATRNTQHASLISLGYLPPESVSECLSAADLCILPYSDGVSARRGTLWAALQHGLPILTTCAGTEPATIGLTHGDNVWLVSANGSAEELQTAILTLALSSSLRERLGENGRALGVQNTWDHIASRTMEMYEQVNGSMRQWVNGFVDSLTH